MHKTAVLFSGGSDSTLAAALEAEQGQLVDLLTFNRISFIGATDYTQHNLKNLRRVYGYRISSHQVIKIDHLHKTVCYGNYLKMFRLFGIAVTGLCFSKLSMHWATAIYCKKNNITRVVDGSTSYMNMYPDQNKDIAHFNLISFYKKIGITYETPIFNITESVEQKLYDRGITTQPEVRGTEQDLQVYYLEQVLLALFLKFYLSHKTMHEYESIMSQLYQNRLDFILKKEFSYAP